MDVFAEGSPSSGASSPSRASSTTATSSPSRRSSGCRSALRGPGLHRPRRLDRRRDRRGHRLQDQPPALHPRRGRHLAADEPLRGGGAPPLAVGEEGEADLLDAAPRRPAGDDAHRGAARRRARLRRDARAADGDRDGVPGAPLNTNCSLLRPPQSSARPTPTRSGKREFIVEDPPIRRRRPRARGGRSLAKRSTRGRRSWRTSSRRSSGARRAGARRRPLPDVRDDEPRLPARADAHCSRTRRVSRATRCSGSSVPSTRRPSTRSSSRWARSSTSRASRC